MVDIGMSVTSDRMVASFWIIEKLLVGFTFFFLNIIFTHLKHLPNDSMDDFKLIGENRDFIVEKMTEI